MTDENRNRLVIATRLHLGRASSPPSEERIHAVLTNLCRMAENLDEVASVLIAVDAAPKLENYDHVEAIRSAVESYETSNVATACAKEKIEILPVMPWGKFVPALNALVLHAKSQLCADLILFVSAEVDTSPETIRTLCQHVTSDYGSVLVAGAAMDGHLYAGKGRTVALTGRTTPWNTLSVWNLDKLSMIGFAPISDLGSSAGVEECAAIALLQKLFPGASTAKLVKLEDVDWEESFEDDERKKWHEEKMKSKMERPARQMELLGLSGTVLHC